MSTPLKRLLIVALFLLGPLAVFLAWQSSESEEPERVVLIPSIHATDLERTTVYRSPQQPGYTSWVGAWLMPDDSMMIGFDQARGPVDPDLRELAPAEVVRAFGGERREQGFDFWGLQQSLWYLRSTDGGKSWRRFRAEPFKAVFPQGYTPQATIALKDGTILRRVNGDDLRHRDDVPHTAFLQRLEPGAERWNEQQVLLDPGRYTYQLSRLRYLKDGRLIATGNVWDVPASTRPAERGDLSNSRFLLMVSKDDGRTWQNGLRIPPDVGYLPGNEWDTAELPNGDGDMVAVMRTLDAPANPEQVRKTGILRKEGDGWVLTDVKKAPFPHSGHPELLATREGPVLHIATTGVHYTKDGITWRRLRFRPIRGYRSFYYPRALQTPDGVVHVFGHVGSDDPYGAVNQSIRQDTFRLVKEPL